MRTLLLFALAWLAAAPVFAGGGDDHSHAPEPQPLQAAQPAQAGDPKLAVASADFELVGVLKERELWLYLDQFSTNEPITQARIEMEGGLQGMAEETTPGEYRIKLATPPAAGVHNLVFTVIAGKAEDLLPAVLEVAPVSPPAAAVTGQAAARWHDSPRLLQAGLAVMTLLFLLSLYRRGAAVLLLAAGLAAGGQWPQPAAAHGGEDHSHPEEAAAALPQASGGKPQRLADGSVYVPKPAQRLLQLRTIQVRGGEMAQTFTLNGHIIADPNASGTAQAPVRGRIEAAEGGLPKLGQKVSKGEVLAYLLPIPDAVDEANQQAGLAELTGKIRILGRNLERLKQLGNNAPRKELDETEAELVSLAERRKVIAGGLRDKLPLTAPVAGVISLSDTSPGQIAEPGKTLFAVVDPAKFWVEALLYDPYHADHITGGTAQTAAGEVLELERMGVGYELREHALPLQFRIQPPIPFLSVEQPVKVFARTIHILKGMQIPAESLLRGESGESLVWLHVAPEHFKATPVQAQDFDAASVVVTQGLNPGDRVVTQGASLLAQIR
jgi:hypothetical protein